MLDATLGLESSGSNIGLPKKNGARSIDCEEVFGRSSSQALLEMLEEEDDRITKRVKTKTLDKKKGRKRYFNNIAAAKRLTVNFMIPRAATGETYRSLKVSSFVFRERRFHSSRVFNGCFALYFSICEEIACTFFGE